MTSPTLSQTPPLLYRVRSFEDRDYGPVSDLFRAHDLETMGSTNYSEEFLRADWDVPAFNPLTDVAVAVGPDDIPVGVIACYAIRPVPTRPMMWVYAHAAHRLAVLAPLYQRGLELAARVIERVPADARVVAESFINHGLHDIIDAARDAGFVSEHVSYSMLIRFDGPLPQPQFPDGLRVITYADRPDVALWAQTVKTSFADHRGAMEDMPLSYDIARAEKEIAREGFDPSVWWLVMDGDTPAAVCISFTESDEYPNTAYIHQLGTIPAYRKRGIALALLHHAFQEHRKAGRDGVLLGVDGSSLTNAVALYQRAGMHINAQWDKYERELRPGVELTKQ